MIKTPYNVWKAITKSDTVPFELGLSAAIYVGGAGVVVAVQEDGNKAAFTCVAGQILPLRAMRVDSTNTTATLMIALYQV